MEPMESVRLLEFYRSMTSWPRTKAELGATAERIARLLDCPFVAIDVMNEDERLAYKIANGAAMPQTDSSLLEELLRGQFRRAEELFSGGSQNMDVGLRQLQISRETTPLAGILSFVHLTFAVIPRPSTSAEVRPIPAARKRREPGVVMIGSVKALSDREQVLLLAATHKLAELSAITRLEAAINLRSQFLSIASHELKTPLTSIYGILQLQERLMKMKPGDETHADNDERQRSFLKISIRQVQRLNELIDGLLAVSRIQNGRFMVEPSQTDVAAALRDTVGSRLTLIAQESNVSLQVEAPETLLAWVDPVRLEEVITNLVMNAIRFSPEGGVVWLRLRNEGGAFRLTVRDQGPNVPAEDSERIFQPFERAQRTGRLGGLGLGLYISRQIAQLHGGNVSLVESIPGKGNVFEAYFPAVAAGHASNLMTA
jgi:signal transduction histidine kinase